jgi:hypothetical protein
MRFFLTASSILAAFLTLTFGNANAGVSISLGEPGFFGRIDIGNAPPPRVIYEEPIIVRRVKTWYPPIYLRVPRHHRDNWYRYCDSYGACGRPVYFVDDSWYEEVYVPRYREDHHRVYVPAGPPPPPPPTYYEYRKHHRKPPEKVYIREEYYYDGRRY